MTTFIDLGLNASVLSAITEMGFENPTPIQEKSIPVFLENERDILGLAQTGTGKTAAFGLPLLQLVDFNAKQTQALIICPTRELCMQISRDLTTYSKHMQDVRIVSVYGGASINGQIEDLRRGAQIIVATPGRLIDLMSRRAVNIKSINYVVLDEADEMLNMGFREDIEGILSVTPDEKRVCLFSATMPKEIRSIANQYMKNPVEISVGKANSSNANIAHEYAVVHAKDKYAAFKRILDFNNESFYGIIFCTTKHETQDISDKLVRDGYNADCLHGDLSQGQREKVMNRFRHKAIKILLATDVAARGIDVSDLTHVIHYHLPDDIENYTHRSGRTARAGKLGTSIALLNVREFYRLREIEKLTNIKFNRIMIPSAMEVRDKKLLAFIDTINSTEIEETFFDDVVEKHLKPLLELDKEELMKKMLSLELRRFSAEYMNGPDLNVAERGAAGARNDGGGNETYGSSQGTRLFVSIGQKDGLNVGSLKDFVSKVTEIPNANIYRVDVKGVYSFINVDAEQVEKVMSTLHGSEYEGRPVRVEISGNDNAGGRSRSGGDRGGRSYGGDRGGDRGGRSYGGDRGGSRGGYGGDRGGDRGGRSYGGDRGGDRGGRSYGGDRDGGSSRGGSTGGGERRRTSSEGDRGSRGGDSNFSGARRRTEGSGRRRDF
ncbi:MAG: DEAD/DEAH box helicase [Bacteroidia bacterium]|nr:DEAD/DEAH box helicase [Bacteroidia bacterium]